ncbi:hypothetical protein Q8A73_021431 [Channa argus]|nr:hypothetical protein Q8A73_021431 [Channa argus]
MLQTNEPQVGYERGRSNVYEPRLENIRRAIIAVVVGVSFPNRTSPSAFSSSPPAAPTGCPRGSPLQEHHVTTLTPASLRPVQKQGHEPCGEREEERVTKLGSITWPGMAGMESHVIFPVAAGWKRKREVCIGTTFGPAGRSELSAWASPSSSTSSSPSLPLRREGKEGERGRERERSPLRNSPLEAPAVTRAACAPEWRCVDVGIVCLRQSGHEERDRMKMRSLEIESVGVPTIRVWACR